MEKVYNADMEKWHVIFIYATNCKDCERMKSILNSFARDNDNIDIKSYDSSTDEAIRVALKHGIEDIPGCWVDPRNVFCGVRFNESALKKALSCLVAGLESGSYNFSTPRDDAWIND